MAAPVISSTQSYLGFRRNEPFQFFPSATNVPLSWSLDKEVTGLAIDTPAIWAATGDESTDVVTATGHDFVNGSRVYFRSLSGGSGLAANTVYWVRDVSGATFKLAGSQNGAAIDFSSALTAGQIQKVSTGRIYSTSGIATQGPIVLQVTATNGDGSGTREFVIGIGPGTAVSAAEADTAIDLAVDVVTGLVRMGREMSALTAAELQPADPVALIKSGDTRLFAVRFFKAGQQIDPELTALKMVFKQYAAEGVLVTADSFEKIESGAAAVFRLAVIITRANVAGTVADNEGDRESFFSAVAELEWRATVTHDSNPLDLVGSTQNFTVRLSGDLATAD